MEVELKFAYLGAKKFLEYIHARGLLKSHEKCIL